MTQLKNYSYCIIIMAEYHVLTGLVGDAVTLENDIDNECEHKRIGLREITYVTGWNNIAATLGNNVFSVRPTSTTAPTHFTVLDGYYNVHTLEAVVSASMPGFSVSVNHPTGRVILTLSDESYQLDLASTAAIWGFKGAAKWKGAGTYTSDDIPGFFNKRNLYVHLNEINTTGSLLNGRNSTLLRIIPTSGESYGESRTVTFERPQFRHLRGGGVQELTVRILDDSGMDISANTQPFCVTLEVADKHEPLGPRLFQQSAGKRLRPVAGSDSNC